MQYADLSLEQRQAFTELERIIRPLGRKFIEAASDAALISESHVINTESILDLLDPGAEIPNTTDLANAAPVTKEEFQSLLDDLKTVTSNFGGEDRTLVYIKAAGINTILE